MNRLEEWVFDRILAKEVRQGVSHGTRIEQLYRRIRQAAEREFVEDSPYSLQQYLRDRFNVDQLEG